MLRALQKEAPRIPFEVVQEELALELPGWRRLFREIEPEAFENLAYTLVTDSAKAGRLEGAPDALCSRPSAVY